MPNEFRCGVSVILCVVLLLLPAGSVFAATVSYQGRLTDDAGTPVSGSVAMKFAVFDAPGATGVILWQEDQTVTADDGIFNVLLGAVTPFPDGLFEQPACYLEIAVDGPGGTEVLTPRQPVTATARAIVAEKSRGLNDGALTTVMIADNAVTADQIADGSVTADKLSGGFVPNLDADLLDGLSATAFAPSGHDHDTRYFTKTESDDRYVNTTGDHVVGFNGGGAVFSVENTDIYPIPIGIYGTAAFCGVYGNNHHNDNAGGLGTQMAGAWGDSDEGIGVYGVTESGHGVAGEATGDDATAVYGHATATANATNYGGRFLADGVSGHGVYATVSGSNGVGIKGEAMGSNGIGVYGHGANRGGYFWSDGDLSTGVTGLADATEASGVYGQSEDGTGVKGYSDSQGTKAAVLGVHGNTNYGQLGSREYGAYARHYNGSHAYLAGSGAGVYGQSSNGHIGWLGSPSYGVYGSGSTYAGFFNGNVRVIGNVIVDGHVTKSGGTFRIDHPLDPTHRYLNHSFVESPDMMNVYNGIVTLDDSGAARVEMPEWFQTLNRDFRYQLTPIGAAMPDLHVSRKMENNRFWIAGGKPGKEISWQVTGIRQDPWAEANRIEVEEDKPLDEQGTYLHPDVYN